MKNILILLFLLTLISCGKKTTISIPGEESPAIVTLPYTYPEGLISPVLINGEVVDQVKYPEVVSIRIGSSGCTGTLVGPKVLITAAHCGGNGATVTFSVPGNPKVFSGTLTRSSLYPGRDHDVALVLLRDEVPNVKFASIGGVSARGQEIIIFGFGCTRVGGGTSDGKLRMGRATVTGFTGWDMVTGQGAALCFGDSGGPAFLPTSEGGKLLLGVNSKGDISSVNYHARLDTADSQNFLKKFAQDKAVEICGVNKDCKEDAPIDPPTPPNPERGEVVVEYKGPAKEVKIPDGPLSGVQVSFLVTQGGTFLDLSLSLHISHTLMRDLTVSLISPNGKKIDLLTRPEGLGQEVIKTFGMNGEVIDLSQVGEENVQGLWKLRLSDHAPGDEGVLKSAVLKVKTLLKK